MIRTEHHKWTDEQREYMKRTVPGRPRKETHEMFNKKFNLDLTIQQIIGYMKRNNLKTGCGGRFVKGQKAWNKGMKGLNTGGSEGWFEKGHVPYNYKPIGSERIDHQEGYVIIKVQDEGKYQKRWRHKHVVVWEKHHGKVPADQVVAFLDEDRTNTDIDNLVLLTRREMLYMNQEKLFSSDPDVTKVGIALVKLKQRVVDLDWYGGDFENVKKHMEIANRKGIARNTFIARLRRGWTLEDAVKKPLHHIM